MSNQNKKINYYQIFKYTVYLAVFINIGLFLDKELAAAAHRFTDGFTWDKRIEAFSATIDTAAWTVLLILFELETYVLSPEQLKGRLRWLLRTIRGFCYITVVYSFTGYAHNYLWLQHFSLVELTDLCQTTTSSFMKELDEFVTITSENCAQLTKNKVFLIHEGKSILTDAYYYQETVRLAVIDIMNSMSWILVVIVLEIDVWLQLHQRFVGRVIWISKFVKNILYTILFFAAVYWGVFGEFLEFWDAFLWIVAFVFIELNLFKWHKESKGNFDLKN